MRTQKTFPLAETAPLLSRLGTYFTRWTYVYMYIYMYIHMYMLCSIYPDIYIYIYIYIGILYGVEDVVVHQIDDGGGLSSLCLLSSSCLERLS
jgi:hypothetical protein